MESSGASMFAALVLIGLAILIQVLLVRWLFRIDTIVKNMQYTNAMLIRLLQRQGATDQEINDTLYVGSQDLRKLLDRSKKS